MSLVRSVLLAIMIATTGMSAAAAKPDEAALVAQAQARGKLIHDLDQAAWHSTDVLLKALPKARHGEIKGWIVEPGEGGATVVYYGYEGDTPYGVFTAVFRDGKVVSSREIKPGDADRAFTPVQQRMALARKVATTAKVQPCARAAFNTVIVPPASATARSRLISAITWSWLRVGFLRRHAVSSAAPADEANAPSVDFNVA